MIIPWQQIAPDTLENLIKEYIVRNHEDLDMEYSLRHKIDKVKRQLQQEVAVITYSELHNSFDIRLKQSLL